MKKILILGAGFGGLNAYLQFRKKLKKRKDISITLINENNSFLYSPMLHEAAFGSVEPSHILHPIRHFLRHTDDVFFEDRVVQIIPNENKVLTKHARNFLYDYLLIALGSQQAYFQIPGAKHYTYKLKSFADVITLRNSIIETFEQVQKDKDISFVVVGGGSTGVEIAAQLAELIQKTILKLYPHINKNNIQIDLIHDAPRLVPHLAGKASMIVRKRLSMMGIRLHLQKTVKEVKENAIVLDDGKELASSLTIWSAGIAPNSQSVMTDRHLDESGFIATTPSLLVEGLSNVLAIGDTAKCAHQNVPLAPKTAQAAKQQGKHAANNILRLINGKKPTAFHYHHKGDILPLGDWYAVAQIQKWVFAGRFAWWLRRTVFLVNIFSLSERIRIVIDWIIGIFTPRDTTKIE